MTGLNPARAADVGHARTAIVSLDDGLAVGCSCRWYEQGLPSKRRAYSAHARHVAEQAPEAPVDLSNSAGRGKAAALAHRRARSALIERHPSEFAELERLERERIGLPPTPTGAP